MKRNNPDINAIIAALGGSPLKKKNQYLQNHNQIYKIPSNEQTYNLKNMYYFLYFVYFYYHY